MLTRNTLTLCAVVFLLTGCGTIGQKQNFANIVGQLTYQGKGHVIVGAWDQRSYVLSGDKSANFVGLQRNRYGIPFNVTTTTGHPLAQDMALSLVQSLDAAGYDAQAVAISPDYDAGNAHVMVLQGHPWRSLLLTIHQWESITYQNPTLYYNLQLTVYSGGGRKLASTAIKGKEDMDGRFFYPAGKARVEVEAAFKSKIEQLLNAPKIVAAMK